MNIAYWRQGMRRQNFGDSLTELLIGRVVGLPRVSADCWHLIGSVIADEVIETDLDLIGSVHNPVIAFWGCGARDEAGVRSDLYPLCRFHGVRGPLTRDVLGLPKSTPLGDPALLLPLVHKPDPFAETANLALGITHIHDPSPLEDLRIAAGLDVVLSAGIDDDAASLTSMIDAIVSARFVLCGALHAAIVAAAYGRPFAYWDTGHIDLPFKWRDAAESFCIPTVFARTVAEGEAFYEKQMKRKLQLPPLAPILLSSPLQPLPRAIVAALRADKKLEHGIPTELDEAFKAAEQGVADAVHSLRDAAPHLLQARRSARYKQDALMPAVISPEGQQAVVDFRDMGPGTAFLGAGWNAPGKWGPWSILDTANLTLPASSKWAQADALVVEGHVYTPVRAPFHGLRRVLITANDSMVVDTTIESTPGRDSVYVSIMIPLSAVSKVNDADLTLTFVFPVGQSLAELDEEPSEWRLGLNIMTLSGLPAKPYSTEILPDK